jgi:hypothetical protein
MSGIELLFRIATANKWHVHNHFEFTKNARKCWQARAHENGCSNACDRSGMMVSEYSQERSYLALTSTVPGCAEPRLQD